MSEESTCFICKRTAIDEFTIIVDNGGKLHNDSSSLLTEKTYICKIHLKESEDLKKKKGRQQKDDFM